MKKKRSLRKTLVVAALVSLISLIFSTCASQNGGKVPVIGNPEVKIERISIERISFQEVDLLCSFSVRNPYPAGISIAGFDYDFRIEENSFVSGRQDKGLEIPGRDKSSIELPISLSFEEIRDTIEKTKGKKTVPYELLLGIDVDVPLGSKTIRLSQSSEGELPVPSLPKISIKDVIIKKFGLSTIFLEFGILVQNPNSFEATIGSVDYLVHVGESTWAEGETGRSYSFPPGEDRTVYVPIELNYMRIGRTIVDILMSGRELAYSIRGSSSISVDTGEFSIPEYQFSYRKEGNAALIRP